MGLRMDSRYGILGSRRSHSTLNLLASFAATTSMAVSPRPLSTDSAVSTFFSTRMVGSSSIRRFRPEKILSSSPAFLAYTALEMQGAGKSMSGNCTGLAASHRVLPVASDCSLASAHRSPAHTFWVVDCCLPFRM